MKHLSSSNGRCCERKGKGKGKGDGGGGGGTLTVDDDVKARVVTSEVKEEEGGDEVLLNGEIKIKIRAWMMRQVVRCLEIRAAAAAADKDNSSTSTNSSSAPLSPVMKHGNCMLSLTPSQLHELQLQALIFKYIAAGLPVPPPLLLPILKTVSTSSPFVGFSTVQGFRNKDLMDPEPWRCRRTDGKKWRCGRPVVSGQKYCERHMHRGCKRSRKPVEASQTTTANSDEVNNLLPQDSQFTIVPSDNSSKNSENSIPNQFNLTPLSSQRTDLSLSNNAMVRSPAGNGNGDLKITGITMSLVADADPQETTSTTVATGTILGLKSCLKTTVSTETTNGRVASNNKNKCSRTSADRDGIDDWTSNFSFTVSCKNIVNRSSSDNNNNKIVKNVASNVSQVLDFSPKSVLQVHGSSGVELETGRCRRTDGKKWRCRRDAVSNQKYCGMHLHRGAKKRSKSSEFDVSSNSNQHTKVILPNKADCTNLSTDLSISIAISPPLMTTDHASSSSDATISDTIVSAHDS